MNRTDTINQAQTLNEMKRVSQAQAAGDKRIIGYDFARGISVFGMFLMNFKIVMYYQGQKAQGVWAQILEALEGRFAVLFIILAGMGVSLITRKARQTRDPGLLAEKRKTLLIRAAFLFIVGLVYMPVWEADILHYYGVYIGIGAFILTWKDQWLITASILSTLAFICLFFIFNWEAGWNFSTLSYTGFWTLDGFLGHTFFNGFHPVFPWMAFFIFGLVMGRKNLVEKALGKKCLEVSLLVFICCELISYALVKAVNDPEAGYFFSTLSFPPFPLFIISGMASSMIIIILCVRITEKLPPSLTRPLVSTGQMVLTHYVSHVIIGMAILEMMGMLYNQSLAFSIFYSSIFFLGSVLFSVTWHRYFAKGPLEIIMRKISG